MVEHPYLGRHIDEVQIDVHAVDRATVLSVSSTLQEYIDGACSISCPLWPIIERGVFFYRQISLAVETEQHELIMSWRQLSRHVPYATDTTLDSSSKIDWREVMSWYPLDCTIFFVGSMTEQPLDIADVTNSSWQWGTGRHFFSTPSRFQQSRISVGLSQDLDWRELIDRKSVV